jgi:hypothetical protein
MFKKIEFKGLNYHELERYDAHDIKREKLHTFYQTFDFINLIRSWPDLIGPALAAVTCPLKIKGDTLIILSKHASYSQNISFLSEEIKRKIFIQFPELRPVLKRLNFQTQENFFRPGTSTSEVTAEKPPAPKYHPQDPRYKILKGEADRLFADVPDSELKEILTSIYLQSK